MLFAAAVAVGLVGGAASTTAAAGETRAGVGKADASWHVGASAGPVRDRRQLRRRARRRPDHPLVSGAAPRTGSSRASGARARGRGRRTAAASRSSRTTSTSRRTCSTGAPRSCSRQGDSGITRANLTMAVTHDHSSPYYSSTSWGVVGVPGRLRRALLRLLREAHGGGRRAGRRDLKPVRIGASVDAASTRPTATRSARRSPTTARRPATRTRTTDHDLTVVRFDDVSDPAQPEAARQPRQLLSCTPSSSSGNDLICADYVGAAPAHGRPRDRRRHDLHPERGRHRRAGAQHLPLDPRAARVHAPRLRPGRVRRAPDGRRDRRHVARHRAAARPSDPDRFVPFDDRARRSRWRTAGSRARSRTRIPGVSNCRTDKALAGDPQIPVVGLPDCETAWACSQSARRPVRAAATARPADRPDRPGPLDRRLPGARDPAAGELLGARPTPGSRRTSSVHLQAFRLGDILFTVCSCEQWADQSANIKTRTDTDAGQRVPRLRLGRALHATTATATTWTCPNPRQPVARTCRRSPTTSSAHARAGATTTPTGWNDPSNVAVGRVRADRPDADQGQLHARRAAAPRSATG